ncbi:MAG: AI-2E family transporter [Agitococcus sp.]|nr:AI-2E family transporter [Agitococcus sp.]
MAILALGAVLKFDLIVAMLATCASFALASSLPSTKLFRRLGRRAQMVATVVVAAVPVIVLVAVGISLAYLGQHANAAYLDVVQELSKIVSQWRGRLPVMLASHLPSGPEAIKPWLAQLVQSQSNTLAAFGKSSAHGLLMALVGGVIGLLLANGRRRESADMMPLSVVIARRAHHLDTTFRSIVVAQFWIASINTTLTAIFFYGVLPLMGEHMPYALSLLVLTFLAGMLPVAGNLLCNTVTTLVGLSVGPMVAVAALIFLVVIHKLEYVINAKVVGSRMHMAAWELLSAMFVLEAVFGVPGLVAAPFFYAYLKAELRELQWV